MKQAAIASQMNYNFAQQKKIEQMYHGGAKPAQPVQAKPQVHLNVPTFENKGEYGRMESYNLDTMGDIPLEITGELMTDFGSLQITDPHVNTSQFNKF